MSNFVTPLKTPWMLSTTERELQLEETEPRSLQVSFLGFFGNFINDGDSENVYQDVTILFLGVFKYKYFADYSKDDAKRIDDYNWDRIPEYRDEEGSLAGHQDKFNEIWRKTGRCPNPAVYVVENSDWVKSESSSEMLKHYLLLGGDYNLEVLAEGCSL